MSQVDIFFIQVAHFIGLMLLSLALLFVWIGVITYLYYKYSKRYAKIREIDQAVKKMSVEDKWKLYTLIEPYVNRDT